MRKATLLTAAVLLLTGCAGISGSAPAADAGGKPTAVSDTPDAPTPTDDAGTTRATATPAVPDVPAYAAGERAIAAEKARIRTALSDRTKLTDLSFGILRPAEASTVERKETGAIVAVTVGYSISFEDCSLDGAATRTRYLVSEDRARLLAVEQGVTDTRSC